MGKNISKKNVITYLDTAKTELEKAIAELEQVSLYDPKYISCAVHTLHNYLSVSFCTVDLLLMHLRDHPDTQVNMWLKGLRHATELMKHTVYQLNSVSFTSGEEFVWEKVDMVLGVGRMCNYYQELADRKHIRIIIEESDLVSPYALTDRVIAGVILDNLLSNAVKYSPPGKRVWVRVKDKSGYLVSSVRDEGVGLSKEDQGKLFQKGIPLSPKPTGGESCFGYGLAISKELALRLGGNIWCKSELGKGSCFFFSVPVYSEKAHLVYRSDSRRIED